MGVGTVEWSSDTVLYERSFLMWPLFNFSLLFIVVVLCFCVLFFLVVFVLFCSLTKGITPNICRLCSFVLINSVLLNLLCFWILC